MKKVAFVSVVVLVLLIVLLVGVNAIYFLGRSDANEGSESLERISEASLDVGGEGSDVEQELMREEIAGEIVPSEESTDSVILDMDEISKHNIKEDCWILIFGKVYDVSGYAIDHPGGEPNILNNCGTDAGKEFKSKGTKGEDHKSTTYEFINSFYIGELNGVYIA